MVKGFPSKAFVTICDGRDRASIVLNLLVLHNVLKARTLRMNPTRTTIAQKAHSTTCNTASILRTWILGGRARVRLHII